MDFNLVNQIAWAPDGKSLTLLSSRSGLPNLWNQPIDGSAAKPMTDFKTGQIFNFAWSADGKNILLARGAINNDLILIRDPERTSANSGPSKNVARKRSFARVFYDAFTSIASRIAPPH
jgi:Tol biopolymer transport system component